MSSTIRSCIDYLNAKCGTKYKPTTASTQRHLRARIEEGYRLEDFKAVIDRKAAEWGSDPEMAQYLRPQTLFGPKFESYLEAPKSRKQSDIQTHGWDYDELERKAQALIYE